MSNGLLVVLVCVGKRFLFGSPMYFLIFWLPTGAGALEVKHFGSLGFPYGSAGSARMPEAAADGCTHEVHFGSLGSSLFGRAKNARTSEARAVADDHTHVLVQLR